MTLFIIMLSSYFLLNLIKMPRIERYVRIMLFLNLDHIFVPHCITMLRPSDKIWSQYGRHSEKEHTKSIATYPYEDESDYSEVSFLAANCGTGSNDK